MLGDGMFSRGWVTSEYMDVMHEAAVKEAARLKRVAEIERMEALGWRFDDPTHDDTPKRVIVTEGDREKELSAKSVDFNGRYWTYTVTSGREKLEIAYVKCWTPIGRPRKKKKKGGE